MRNVIIIGSGPAGLTAAIYTGRAMLNPLVLEGVQPGGQLTTTNEVENFPGFPEGILGQELMDKMRQQAQKFGAETRFSSVKAVDFTSYPFKVTTDDDEVIETRSVIIATGASARYLGLESEQKLIGHGVSACATCDGFFFKGKEIAVVGGGDSAMEEAMFLTRFASKVTIVHRRDKFRASKVMVERAKANPKIAFLMDSVVVDVLTKTGKEVTGIKVKNVKTGEETIVPVEGVFVAIGHKPNTDVFKGQIELDDQGYIVLKGFTQTSVEGVFAAGDCTDKRYRQAITAAGMGCQAAIDCTRFLEEKGV